MGHHGIDNLMAVPPPPQPSISSSKRTIAYSKRKLLFVASVAFPVILVVYSEYLSLQSSNQEKELQKGVVLHSLSEFRPPIKRQVLEFQRSNSTTTSTDTKNSSKPSSSSSSSIGSFSIDQQQLSPNNDYSLPPLHTILDPKTKQVIGDPQIMLQYSIIGFGKCGTTSMLHLLQTHSQLQSLDVEVWSLIERNPARLIERLYKKLQDKDKKRGYKCPGQILGDYVLDYYRTLWPKTALFVGVRHPVLWFQSLYNFRVQNSQGLKILAPNDMIGQCTKAMNMICTKRGHFAYYMMQMGKHLLPMEAMDGTVKRRPFTNLEKRIAKWFNSRHYNLRRSRIKPMPNPVFLFDMHQLADSNETRRAQLRHDLAMFLGVSPTKYNTNSTTDALNHFTPGRVWDAKTQALKDAIKINICDPKHLPTRIELLRQARASSVWIRTVFMNSPGVHVSSRDYVEELLEKWMHDPCNDGLTNHINETFDYDNVVDWRQQAEEGDEDAVSISEAKRAMKISAAKQVIKSNFEKDEYSLPPLYENIVLPNGTLVGDPQILLHFAIIGFGKCGTTTLMLWLHDHPELQSLQDEIWALPGNNYNRLLSRLYRKLKLNLQRGYKCPGDILSSYARDFYREHMPKTKLFIGVRHPVLWFQSLYNFRIQNYKSTADMPHPNSVIGLCRRASKLICTQRGNFGHHLLKLGKHVNATTRPFSPLEQQLSQWYPKNAFGPENITSLPNDIFIFEVSQLGGTNETRKQRLRHGIQEYLGLTQELSPEGVHFIPGKKWSDEIQAAKDRLKIDICNDEYLPLRSELMLQARTSSLWIRQVFLDSPGVYMSSREDLEELLEKWMIDPCNNKTDGVDAPSVVNAERRRENAEARRESQVELQQKKHQNEAKESSGALNDDLQNETPEDNDPRPPLSSIIGEDGSITGDPQFLLHFAIIGFGKSGTSSMLHWLSSHPETQCLTQERWYLMHGDPQKLISSLYKELPSGEFKRCYKCPGDVTEMHILDYYRRYFSKTKLIIGVRHPVLWFQSLYNFRIQQLPDNEVMLHPNKLIGTCYKFNKLVCTRKGHYAFFLMRLGKQFRNGVRPFTDLENQILDKYKKYRFEPEDVPYMPNEIFLYEVSQLAATKQTRRKEFAEDLTDFLDLQEQLPELPNLDREGELDDLAQASREKKKIDICEDEFIPVRKELTELARMSSRWIRETFLDLEGVFFSSTREEFEAIFLTWMHDPCGPKSDTISPSELEGILAATVMR